MSKAHGNKLIKEFESAINEYLASFDSLVNKNFSPNFEKIEKFLKQNKSILKKNKRGYPARQLREFYQYLKSLNGDDQTIMLLDFYEGNKTIVLSGKATEAYKALLKEIESYLPQKEHIEKTVFPITTHYSLSTGIKSVANSVAKNAATLTGSLGESLIAAASNPWFSFKAATSFALYALAGQPVAGMTIAGNIKKKQRDSMFPTINHLLSTNESDWFRYYDSIETMLQEFESNASEIDEDNKRLFFKFLEEVLTGDKASKLSDESKERLFHITKKELKDDTSNFDEISDVEKIYRLFFIFSSSGLGYKKDQSNVQTIFELLDRYATKLAFHHIKFNSANEARIKHEIKKVFWVLNANFDEHAKSLVSFFGVDEFKRHFDVLQKMNRKIYQWDSDSIFSFRFSLDIIRRLHFYYLKNNQEIGSYLKDNAHAYVTEILHFVKNDCLSLTENEIKEAAYIAYVRELPSEARHSFAGLYKEVKKSKVFPHSYQHKVSVSANTTQFAIYSQQQMSVDERSIVNNAINNTHQRVENLKSKLRFNNKEDVSQITFRLHLFKDNEAYVNYGPLWGVNTAGGGYAHVRFPSEEELQFHSSRPFESNKLWYETFIYQQEGDTRNAKNKEGGNFRNLGHEVQHTLFYALMGAQGLHNLPSWLIEGIANYLGNEDCFKEEADYIKNFQKQGRLPSVARIINFNYANGGDLYYFGSTLARFMLEKHPNILKEILTKAQAGEQKSEINRIIKQWAANPTIENDFNTWTTQLINGCSERNQGEDKTTATDAQTEYRKDLQNNPNLLRFIQKSGPIEFTFGDIVFILEIDKVKAASYYPKYHPKTPKEVNSSDYSEYSWFKSALAIYAAQNALTKIGPTEPHDEILARYFDKSIHYIQNRAVKSINPPVNTDFKQTIEDFALKTCFPVAGKKSLSRTEFYDNLSRTRATGSLSSTCQAYLNKKNQKILDNVQTEYRKDLQNNLNLLDFIQENGSIEFIFGDTAFKLTDKRIDRHYNGNSQSMTESAYVWLKSALAVYYTTQIALQSPDLPAKDHNNAIAKAFLRKSDDEIENRAIQATQPQTDTRFNQVIEGFVLNTYFQKSRQEFYAILSGDISTLFDRLPTAVYPSTSTLPPQFTLIGATTKSDSSFTTLEVPTESWRLPILITLPIIFVLGIAAAVLSILYFNKKRKPVAPPDSQQPQATHNFPDSAARRPDSVVSTQPERMPPTPFSANENRQIPQGSSTTPLLANKNKKGKPRTPRPTVPPPSPPILQESALSQNNGPPKLFPKPKFESKNIENNNPFSEQRLPLLPNNDSQNVDPQLPVSNNPPAFFRSKSIKTNSTLNNRNNSATRESLNLPAGNTRNIAATLFNK